MVLGLFLLVLAIGLVVAIHDGGPSVFGDEIIYRRNADAIANLASYVDPHYPPFYSLLLAIGGVAPNWYLGMLTVNAVVSALTVPAMWFLVRSVDLRHRMIPVLLVALLPVHGVYVGFLLAENVAVPLMVVSLALAVRGRAREAPLLGLALAALHLTKYLFLPAVLLLLVVWALRLRWPADGEGSRRVFGPLLMAVGSYAAPLAAWVAYGMASGFQLGDLWGLEIVSATSRGGVERGSISTVLLWLTAYSSYVVLATLGMSVLIAVWLVVTRPRLRWRAGLSSNSALVVSVALLALGYVLLGAQHSLGAPYNTPEPSHMMARYLIHLTPLIIALGAFALERTVYATRPYRRRWVWVPTALVLSVGWFSWWVLFRGGIWGLPAFGARSPFLSVDVYVFANPKVLVLTSLAIIAAVGMLRFGRPLLAAAPLAVSALLMLVLSLQGAFQSPTPGLRQRLVAEYVTGLEPMGRQPVLLWTPPRVFGAGGLAQALEFWRVPRGAVVSVAAPDDLEAALVEGCVVDARGQAEPADAFLVTASELPVEPAFSAGEGKDRVILYALDRVCAEELGAG